MIRVFYESQIVPEMLMVIQMTSYTILANEINEFNVTIKGEMLTYAIYILLKGTQKFAT